MADSTGLFIVQTTDGNELIGTIISQNSDVIMLKTESLGIVSIRKQTIKKIEPIKAAQMVDGQYWFENPHTTRYFFQSNGYGLKKGEGYYQNTWVLFNQASVGITDNFTIGVGMVPLFLFAGPTPLWVTPKISVPVVKDKFNLGAGAFIGTIVGGEGTEGGAFGLVYGTATAGPRDRNVSIGLGYGFANGQWANSPTISLSGMVRTGKKFAFVSENYFIGIDGDNQTLLSVGGRFFGRKLSIDTALILPVSAYVNSDSFFAIPWLGLNVPFSTRKRVK